jgi:hypothetical protein
MKTIPSGTAINRNIECPWTSQSAHHVAIATKIATWNPRRKAIHREVVVGLSAIASVQFPVAILVDALEVCDAMFCQCREAL